jgi:hypothetical protein
MSVSPRAIKPEDLSQPVLGEHDGKLAGLSCSLALDDAPPNQLGCGFVPCCAAVTKKPRKNSAVTANIWYTNQSA